MRWWPRWKPRLTPEEEYLAELNRAAEKREKETPFRPLLYSGGVMYVDPPDKPTVHYGEIRPQVAQKGDMWFGPNNQMYKHDGCQWQKVDLLSNKFSRSDLIIQLPTQQGGRLKP